MKNPSASPEERADQALESFDGLQRVGVPDGLEEKMFARFELEFPQVSKTPKWFWAAALLLLAINIVAIMNYSGINKKETASSNSGIHSIASYYFQGGTDWYQNN
jgi:hypothetical protein